MFTAALPDELVYVRLDACQWLIEKPVAERFAIEQSAERFDVARMHNYFLIEREGLVFER